jgi:hypothetical protein
MRWLHGKREDSHHHFHRPPPEPAYIGRDGISRSVFCLRFFSSFKHIFFLSIFARVLCQAFS